MELGGATAYSPGSSPVTNFEDGIGEGLRPFLGKVVSDTTFVVKGLGDSANRRERGS